MFDGKVAIGNVTVSPALVLAPMSGITTSAFRRFVKSLNPGALGLLVSELISVEGLIRKGARTLEMMRFQQVERPLALQIFGYEIESMRSAACMVEQAGADIVDINCGCPVPKVVKKGGGCELMRQPLHLAKIVNAIVRSVRIPLTIKIRSGWNENARNAVEVARVAESEGAAAVAVHGRTRAQLYRGDCDWNIIGEVASAVKIPVFGSGDIDSAQSAREAMGHGLAGIYVGRAALADPFIFSEIISGCRRDWKSRETELLRVVFEYVKTLREDFPDITCVGKIKQMATRMCRGRSWGKKLCLAMSLADQLKILESAWELAQNCAGVDNH